MINEEYSISAIRNLRAEVKGDLFSSFTPDTLFFDRYLDTFVTFGFLAGHDIGVADSNVPHATVIKSIQEEPHVLVKEKPLPKLTNVSFNVSGRAAMYWYESRSIPKVDLPCITFWQPWAVVKDHINRAIELCRQIDPNLPAPGPLWYVGTSNKIGWYDTISSTKNSADQQKLSDIMRQLHMADPIAKRAMQRPEDRPQMKTTDLALKQQQLSDSFRSDTSILAECYNKIITRK